MTFATQAAKILYFLENTAGKFNFCELHSKIFLEIYYIYFGGH